MQKGYVHFVREIYTYCDNNIVEKALFPVFVNLWGEENHTSGKDLAVMTSGIVSRLLDKKILMKISKENIFETPYGLYKILPHENLIKHDFITDRKMKLLR
jgi:hypothetical protein